MRFGLRHSIVALFGQLVVVVALLASSHPAAAEERVLFYDPDGNHQSIVGITAAINSYFKTANAGLVFQPVQSASAFDKLLGDGDVAFAIVSSTHLRSANDRLTPLLVPAVKGDPYYKKALYVRKDRAAAAIESIAAALPSEDVTGKALVGQLVAGGVDAGHAIVVPVVKDVDAVLALSFGRVHAALIAPGSLDVLRGLNPKLVTDLTPIYQTTRILRPPLCVVNDRASAARRDNVTKIFERMNKDDAGRSALTSMGFEQWTAFEPGMLKK